MDWSLAAGAAGRSLVEASALVEDTRGTAGLAGGTPDAALGAIRSAALVLGVWGRTWESCGTASPLTGAGATADTVDGLIR